MFAVEYGDPAEGGFGYEAISEEFETLEEAKAWFDKHGTEWRRKPGFQNMHFVIARYHHR
jgi:hypothetical protein